jgi:hypothetical protein
LAEDLRRRVPEEAFRSRIPARDDALRVGRHDAVLRRTHDRRQLRRGLRRRPPLGRITDRHDHVLLLVPGERGEADIDRELGAVAATARELEARTHLPGARRLRVARSMMAVAGAVPLGDELVDAAADQLTFGVAEQRLGVFVRRCDRAVVADNDRGVRHQGQERLEQLDREGLVGDELTSLERLLALAHTSSS